MIPLLSSRWRVWAWYWLACASFTLLFFASPQVAHATGEVPEVAGSLAGRVTDLGGAPLANVEMYLYEYRVPYFVARATTDAQGHYAFRALSAGSYRVEARDPSGLHAYAFYGQAVRFADAATVAVVGEDKAGIDIQLSPAGQIVGTLAVTSTVPFTPTQVMVTFYRAEGDGTWTPLQQQSWATLPVSYTFAGLATNAYRLCVTTHDANFLVPIDVLYPTYFAECYAHGGNSLSADPRYGSDLEVAAGATLRADMRLGQISQVQGRAVDDTGQPLTNVMVYAYARNSGYDNNRRTRTDATGHFRFSYLVPGSYGLQYVDPTYAYIGGWYPAGSLFDGGPSLPVNDQTRRDLTLTLPKGATLTGRIRVSGGEPPAQFDMTVSGFDANGQSQFGLYVASWYPLEQRHGLRYNPTTGDYVLPGLPPGRYTLRVSSLLPGGAGVAGNYGSYPSDLLTVGKGETVASVNIQLGEGGQLDQSLAGTVTVGDVPLANVEIMLYRPYEPNIATNILPHLPFLTTTTDVDGHYGFTDLPYGTYQVGVKDPTGTYATRFYTESTTSFVAPALELSGQPNMPAGDLALVRGGTVTGRVTLRGGVPAQDYRLIVYRQQAPGWVAMVHIDVQTDAQGRYRIQGLMPGTYRIGAMAPGKTLYREFWECPAPLEVPNQCTTTNPWMPDGLPWFHPMGKGLLLASDVKVGEGIVSGVTIVVEPAMTYLPSVVLGRVPQPSPSPTRDMVETLAAQPEFSKLLHALEATGLVDALRAEGPFTLFAPTNAAIDSLPAGAWDILLQNPTGQLADILRFHVVPGEMPMYGMQTGIHSMTLHGAQVTYERSGDWIRVNGATIVRPDIRATNGLIHGIDAVILPPPD